jgi:hypothetical protein
MGFALKAARYVEYYANVTEQNTLLLEVTGEYSTSNTTPTECFDFRLMQDIHYSSWFNISYEHKEVGVGDRINIIIVNQNGTIVFYDSPSNSAAYNSEDHYFAAYYVYSTRLNLEDVFTVKIYSNNGDTVYMKNFQINGFKTPFESSSFLPP